MKAIVIPEYGDPDVLQLRDLPAPELRPGHVRIDVKATGINFADLQMRMGRYPEAPPVPFVAGYEVAGIVAEAHAEDVARAPWLKPGSKVMAVTRFGGYAEQVVTPSVKVCPLPESWSYAEGAAFLINFVTAWLGVRSMARIQAGDHLLIHGIAGGVGLAALQIARAAECHVAGTCSGAKAEPVAALGAEAVFDAALPDCTAAVREWAPEGPDVILEPRGGKGLKQSLELVRPLGSVVLFGFREIMERESVDPAKAEMTSGRLLWFNPLSLIERSTGIFMLNIMNLWDDPLTFRRVADQLQQGVGQGRFRPVIHDTLPFDRVADAHRVLHDRRNVGKVVLTLS